MHTPRCRGIGSSLNTSGVRPLKMEVRVLTKRAITNTEFAERSDKWTLKLYPKTIFQVLLSPPLQTKKVVRLVEVRFRRRIEPDCELIP